MEKRQRRKTEERQRRKIENIQFLTAEEVGRILRLSDGTIYKLAKEGEIPGFKIGDSWRFDLEEVMKIMRKKIASQNP